MKHIIIVEIDDPDEERYQKLTGILGEGNYNWR
jgi:hypothetical protein